MLYFSRVRSPKRRVRDDDFVFVYPRISSDILGPRIIVEFQIVFISAETIQGCQADILPSGFRGRRSIWCNWRVTLLAPRIVNDVSCVTLINHKVHFAWQVQYQYSMVKIG